MTIQEKEWARGDEIEHQFGLKPSYLRKLAEQGRIVSRSIKDSPTSHKGVRLYLVASIRKLLEEEK